MRKSLMSWVINILIILAFIVLGFCLIGGVMSRVNGAEIKSHEEIYSWVKLRLGQRDLFPLPEIYILPQVQFLRIYMYYFDYEYSMCQLGCEELVEERLLSWLPKIRGFFHRRTLTVYVMERKDQCLTEVALAHELCNYLLHITRQFPAPCEALDYECHFMVDLTERLSYAVAETYRHEFCGE